MMSKTKTQQPAAFVNKLYRMVEDPVTHHLIRWGAMGETFVVLKHEEFAREVLPRYFKHSNFTSFVRQLNMYGFRKVPHIHSGVLHYVRPFDDHEDMETDLDGDVGPAEPLVVTTSSWEFSHDYFVKDRQDLLVYVKRKTPHDDKDVLMPAVGLTPPPPPPPPPPPHAILPYTSASASTAYGSRMLAYPNTALASGSGAGAGGPFDLSMLMHEISHLQSMQRQFEAQLKELESNQSTLWHETFENKQRLGQQQESMDRLIAFLASVFSNDKLKSGFMDFILLSDTKSGGFMSSLNSATSGAMSAAASGSVGGPSPTIESLLGILKHKQLLIKDKALHEDAASTSDSRSIQNTASYRKGPLAAPRSHTDDLALGEDGTLDPASLMTTTTLPYLAGYHHRQPRQSQGQTGGPLGLETATATSKDLSHQLQNVKGMHQKLNRDIQLLQNRIDHISENTAAHAEHERIFLLDEVVNHPHHSTALGQSDQDASMHGEPEGGPRPNDALDEDLFAPLSVDLEDPNFDFSSYLNSDMSDE